MKRVSVNIGEIVADIKARMSDRGLMAKYSLSFSSVRKVKDQLLQRGLVTIQELRTVRCGGDKPDKKRLDATQFARDFREQPDDYYLMDRYSLSPAELGQVYRRLIDSRILTEFEFFTRDVRVPELDDPTSIPAPASSAVSMVESAPDVWASERRKDRHELPGDFFKDFSGVRIGGGNGSSGDNGDTPNDPRAVQAGGQRATSTIVELVTGDFCPRCGRLKQRLTERACPICGIVFSKVRYGAGRGQASLWDTEFTGD